MQSTRNRRPSLRATLRTRCLDGRSGMYRVDVHRWCRRRSLPSIEREWRRLPCTGQADPERTSPGIACWSNGGAFDFMKRRAQDNSAKEESTTCWALGLLQWTYGVRSARVRPVWRARQRSRLEDLLANTRRQSRFYRHLYAHLPADSVALSDLPAVTKHVLMAAFDDWVTDPEIARAGVEAFIAAPSLIASPYRNAFFVCTSAGTTGHPGIFIHDRGAIDVYRAIMFVRVTRSWFGAGELLRAVISSFLRRPRAMRGSSRVFLIYVII